MRQFKVAERLFQIKPRPARAAAMTKKGATALLNVALVKVIRLVVGWLFTEGTLLENNVRRRTAMTARRNALALQKVENFLRRALHGLIVTRNKHLTTKTTSSLMLMLLMMLQLACVLLKMMTKRHGKYRVATSMLCWT
jgi:hypothetical protein